MSEYNIQMNKYNALNAEYDQLYPVTKIKNVNGLDTALQNNDPRQWGLGSVDGKMLTTDDDLDNIIINGWYSWASSSPTNAPVQYGRMILFGYSNTVTQIVSSDMLGWKNILVMRSRFQGTWSPWEYINPPMALGVEYRTTERHLGKPVYVRLHDFGSLPNNTAKIDNSPANWSIDSAILAYGTTSNGLTIPTQNFGGAVTTGRTVSMCFSKSEISVATDHDRSSISATIFLKYTKTTD